MIQLLTYLDFYSILLLINFIVCFFILFIKNILYNLLFVILLFINSSIFFLIFNSIYTALIFFIVYVGGISILFLFIVLSFDLEKKKNFFYHYSYFGSFFLIFYIIFCLFLYSTINNSFISGELINLVKYYNINSSFLYFVFNIANVLYNEIFGISLFFFSILLFIMLMVCIDLVNYKTSNFVIKIQNMQLNRSRYIKQLNIYKQNNNQ